jgi:predicted amino acid racemase
MLTMISLTGTLAVAQEESTETAALTLSGSITAIDLEKAMITVESAPLAEGQEKQVTEFSLSDTTTIEKDAAAISQADLQVGDMVNIEYTVDSNGQNIAALVLVSVPEPEKIE